jgi:hypothetical protein
VHQGIRRLPPARDGEQDDGVTVASGHNAGCQRRPRSGRPGVGRSRHAMASLTPLAPIAAKTVVGDGQRGTSITGAAARRVLALAGGIVVVVTAGFACRRLDGTGRRLAASLEVAGVQAAAEGEMNHRRDGRDDADKRSHGHCLFPSDYRPQFLSNSRSIARGLRSIARAGLLPVGPSFQSFQRPRSRNWSVRPSARPACALGFCRSGRPFSANQPSVTETIAVPVDDAWPSYARIVNARRVPVAPSGGIH